MNFKGKPRIWSFLYVLVFIGIKIYVDAASCTIPRGDHYRRSVFRPRYGSNTYKYPSGRRIRSRTNIVITCTDDIYHDVATKFSFSKCMNGRWLPPLPQCTTKRRCRAPPVIPGASASERITPYITFPHATTVTYTCDVEMATGSDTITCKDGRWTDTNFQCVDDDNREPQALPLTEIAFPGVLALTSDVSSCDVPTIANGRLNMLEDNTYDVTCDEGYHLVPSAEYECSDGHWIGPEPQCIPVEQTCTIPRGAIFRKSIYRPLAGSNTNSYTAGSVIAHGTKIIAICKNDIYHDVITNWTISECKNGIWEPVLPICKVLRRCQAPPEIPHATASETISPYITFPHGTKVTFTCDVDKMATGDDTIICSDGIWTNTHFKCEDNTEYIETPTSLSPDTNRPDEACLSLTVAHGKVTLVESTNSIYDVTCDEGYRLVSDRDFTCIDGQWIDGGPKCKQVSAPCQFHSLARRRSILHLADSGEVINSMYVDHWTRVVQICRRYRRKRILRCIDGRWRPGLMTCRPSRSRNARTHLRIYSNCEIPKMKGDPARYDDVISGEEHAYNVGDEISHGYVIKRTCEEGFMSPPGQQFNKSVLTVCDNGKWKPKIRRCRRKESDTQLPVHTTNRETTSQTQTTTLLTNEMTSSSKDLSAGTSQWRSTEVQDETIDQKELTTSQDTAASNVTSLSSFQAVSMETITTEE